MHLLVLDDERQITTYIGAVARDLGWTVESTYEVDAFRTTYRNRVPDLVMLDLQLKNSDGIEQLRFLRGETFRGQIILMSGFDARVLSATRQLGDSLGLSICGIMNKPARVAELRSLLREAAERIKTPVVAETRASPNSSASRLDQLSSADVAQAMDANNLHLFLQPLVSAASGDVVKFEALARWIHPQLGMVPPDRFIPLAERDDELIDRLTLWVIRTAISHHKRLAERFGPLPVAVNVSGVNLRRLDFPDQIAAIAAAGGVLPSALDFEVTETVATKDTKSTMDILARLRLKGFGLAMDDFGTGYSSLESLREMPFSELKIDKSYILNLVESRDSFAIVKSVLELASNMGLETVAEGVETAEIARLLNELGATILQGYHIAKPMAIEPTLEWVQNWASSTTPRSWLSYPQRVHQR